MPDVFDANGLQVKTAAEITADLTAGMQGIYGSTINTDPNSPDGQFIGILTQMCVDVRELLVQINASFDPDQAVGVILDQRVTINNIQRDGGTYTSQPVDITVDRTVFLQGLDGNFNNPNGTGYSVQDDSANIFILIDSQTLTAGTHSLDFRAKTIGAVNVPVNTITNPVTIVLGVTAINNSSSAISIGQDEELDPQLRVRRQRSPALASSGYLNGVLAKILDLPGVTQAAIYENVGDDPDDNGIPGHGTWLIVEGGANQDIADTIYATKSYGSNLKGDVTVDIVTASNSLFIAKFDRPTATPLFLKFSIQTTVPDFIFDTTAIKTFIAANLAYNIGAFAETSAVTAVAQAAIASQGGGGVPVLVQVSDDGSAYTDFILAPTLDSQWTVDVSRIDITVLT